ncbi:tyrosine-protein phosphatase [Aestuariibaculum lutulentum]|uniref:Tyrosine-protein phosphatase n=1 Tax=Aestuariibaculum lutulentum TaxID=2920935 RepID=A0ABS9RIT6_9FLAO|nr:tyrosine-protein phosphatase [Aestuariibaculum lutulentum]MCH4552860.1 tyrosine-protein phosphatase [Aestuariibaculum lutulentum]
MLRQTIFNLLISASCAVSLTAQTSENNKSYETHVNLEGEDNFRDMGGFIGADGKRVLYRKLFRSGELSALTDADQETIKQLGLEQVIDLRTAHEVEEKPDRISSDIKMYFYPLMANDPSGKTVNAESFIADVLSGKYSAKEKMLEFYGTIDTQKKKGFETVFNLLETGKTTLWHCQAGQDRAGMTAALVLWSLGVNRADIVKDYLATKTYLAKSYEQYHNYISTKYGKEALEKLKKNFGPSEAFINAFLDNIEKEYGNVDTFLETIHVDVNKMRTNYLES